jgi:hypothetical protein
MVTVADGCAEALCVIVETMRRLECRFAVGALGDANRSRVLKSLDEPFSYRVGERILMGLTYNEATNTATGTKAIADEVFPPSHKRGPDERRVIVVITDGLCSQVGTRSHQIEGRSVFPVLMASVRAALGRSWRTTSRTSVWCTRRSWRCCTCPRARATTSTRRRRPPC